MKICDDSQTLNCMVVDNMIDGETSEKGKRIQEQNVMRDLTIWLTYHDDSQIEQYGLREDDVFRLFKGNAVNVEGDNINHLNAFYSEIVTFYYVWKNNVRSEKVGFCHYRRRFQQLMDIEKGQCQVLAINGNCSVFGHYKISHNYQDFYDAVEILNEQYGQKTLIANTCWRVGLSYPSAVSSCIGKTLTACVVFFSQFCLHGIRKMD